MQVLVAMISFYARGLYQNPIEPGVLLQLNFWEDTKSKWNHFVDADDEYYHVFVDKTLRRG